MTDDLRRALADLPLPQQAALRLKFGLSREHPYAHDITEIAARLEITPGKAHQLVEAGLHRLRINRDRISRKPA